MEKTNKRLIRYLSPLAVFALAFGCSVGWGSFVMPGTTFLPIAGPAGTAIGIVVGALIMLIIGVNYSYLINKYPSSGGTYSFNKHIFGYDHGFLSSWFMGLVYLAIIWANVTAIPLIFRNLFGEVLQFGYLYTIGGYDVFIGEVLSSLLVLLVFGFICIKGKKLASILQIIMSIILISVVVIGFGFIVFSSKEGLNLKPAFSDNHSPFVGSLFIVFLAPWAFAGFESISHSAEEYKFPVKKTFSIMVIALGVAALVYILLVLIGASKLPEGYANWLDYIKDLNKFSGIEGNPVFNSVDKSMGLVGIIFIGLAAACAIITGLIGNSLAASRMIYSMADDGLLPKKLGELDDKGTPKYAFLLLIILTLPIPFLGRSAIGWVVDINTIGVTIAYAYTSAAALKEAFKNKNKKNIVFGIIGIVISIFFLLYFLVPNKWAASKLASESYLMLLFWILIGFIVFYVMFKKDKLKRIGKSTVVWVVMLALVFFTSFIWMRETTNNLNKTAIDSLTELNTKEYENHGITLTDEEKDNYEITLNKTFSNLTSSVLYNTLLLLIIIVISLSIIFTIYRNVQKSHQTAVKDKNIAEQSSNAKTTFLSNMSHDIRTPMNAIIGYVSLAKADPSLSDSTKNYLSKIEASSDHLLALINDVLEMSRIESGKMELAPVPTNLNKIMEDTKNLFSTQMATKGLNFEVNLVNMIAPYVICDANRLNRVLLNLISNAYKFTPAGGTVVVTLEETERINDHVNLLLSVKDNGIGMSKEFAAKVFEAYERERTNIVENIQGTGLGTAITKSIVDMMEGTIDVESEQGKGTTFTIHLSFPIDLQKENEEVEEVVENSNIKEFSGLRLLLVEDNPDNLDIAKVLFEQLGFIVDTAINGEEGVEIIAASKPGDYACVIMDIEMPIKNGYEATRLIRHLKNEELANIPIIALSAKAFSEDIAAAIEAGMNAHIAKPINVEQLKKTLSEILL